MSRRLTLSPYRLSRELSPKPCLLTSPNYASCGALVGFEWSSQSLVHRYMPSLPRSIVGGLNPEGGGEAPNAPKPPCSCGSETLSWQGRVVALLKRMC